MTCVGLSSAAARGRSACPRRLVRAREENCAAGLPRSAGGTCVGPAVPEPACCWSLCRCPRYSWLAPGARGLNTMPCASTGVCSACASLLRSSRPTFLRRPRGLRRWSVAFRLANLSLWTFVPELALAVWRSLACPGCSLHGLRRAVHIPNVHPASVRHACAWLSVAFRDWLGRRSPPGLHLAPRVSVAGSHARGGFGLRLADTWLRASSSTLRAGQACACFVRSAAAMFRELPAVAAVAASPGSSGCPPGHVAGTCVPLPMDFVAGLRSSVGRGLRRGLRRPWNSRLLCWRSDLHQASSTRGAPFELICVPRLPLVCRRCRSLASGACAPSASPWRFRLSSLPVFCSLISWRNTTLVPACACA